MVEWLRGKEISNPNTIIEFEKLHSVSLPPVYKDFIKRHNYTMPNPNQIMVSGLGQKVVSLMLSFNSDDTVNMQDTYEYFEDKDLIPFAEDPGGNFFCFSNHKVVFWEHEEDKIYPVADTFEDFLKMIF
jgi:hypothetical protein